MKGYNFDGYIFAYEKSTDTYIVKRPGGKTVKYQNPIEAWTYYVTIFDVAVRNRIGDMLEKQGKNRYTGFPEVTLKGIDK